MKKLLFTIILAIAFLLCSCNHEPVEPPASLTIVNNSEFDICYRYNSSDSTIALVPTEDRTTSIFSNTTCVYFYKYTRTELYFDNGSMKPLKIYEEAGTALIPTPAPSTLTVTNSGDTLIFNFT